MLGVRPGIGIVWCLSCGRGHEAVAVDLPGPTSPRGCTVLLTIARPDDADDRRREARGQRNVLRHGNVGTVVAVGPMADRVLADIPGLRHSIDDFLTT